MDTVKDPKQLQAWADKLIRAHEAVQLPERGCYAECDAIIASAPKEYQNLLHATFCDLLLDALTIGYHRYSETKGLTELETYRKFKSELATQDAKAPLMQVYWVAADLMAGKKDRILPRISAYLRAEREKAAREGRKFTAENLTYFLVLPLKEGYRGFWMSVGELLEGDDVEAGLPQMCRALELVYYESDPERIVTALTETLQCNPGMSLAMELLGYTYYNLQMWNNALACFERLEDARPEVGIFFEDTIQFWMGWCYGKRKEYAREERCYREALKIYPDGPDTLNNLGYSLYKQRKYSEARAVFEDCLAQKRDMRYAPNNLVRTLLAMGELQAAKEVAARKDVHISKDLRARLERPAAAVSRSVLPAEKEEDGETARKIDLGVRKQQFTSEKILEDELVQRMEMGIPVFGLPLQVYRARGTYGRQFIIPNGRLDILAVDEQGNYYAIELKKDSGYDDAYLQVRAYIDWLQANMAKQGQAVFGLICLNNPSSDLKARVKADPQVRLFEYQISYTELA